MRILKKIKRSRFVFFSMEDEIFVDIALLLRGTVELDSHQVLYAMSVLAGEIYPISIKQLRLLRRISGRDWVIASDLSSEGENHVEELKDLAEKGLIITDAAGEVFVKFATRHEQLEQQGWNKLSALHYFMSKWKDVDAKTQIPDNLEDADIEEANALADAKFATMIDQFGPPPDHFHRIKNSNTTHKLPLVNPSHDLYDILIRRKTTRAYDADTPITREQLSTILQYVFGCQGYLPVFKDVVGLKKTSPSGGGLHPIEVYPLIVNVEGIQSGLYHYSVGDHELEAIELLSIEEARAFANEATAGQKYPRWAGALFIMTARFYRNFWKYREHPKAYPVLLMDAAHLSQTMYLVCTELGLGAFVTAAINGANIESRLGLDGFNEGSILVSGCGVPFEKKGFDPEFLPYIPRSTVLI